MPKAQASGAVDVPMSSYGSSNTNPGDATTDSGPASPHVLSASASSAQLMIKPAGPNYVSVKATAAKARAVGNYLRYNAGTLALGQMISLALCGTGVSATLLEQNGFSAQTTQSLFNYVLLAAIYGTGVYLHGQMVRVIRQDWWRYALLALFDIEANFLAVKAYSYTSLTSVQLLDSLTIPTVMLLSRLLLKSRYTMFQGCAVLVCLLGVGTIVGADAEASDGETLKGKGGWREVVVARRVGEPPRPRKRKRKEERKTCNRISSTCSKSLMRIFGG